MSGYKLSDLVELSEIIRQNRQNRAHSRFQPPPRPRHLNMFPSSHDPPGQTNIEPKEEEAWKIQSNTGQGPPSRSRNPVTSIPGQKRPHSPVADPIQSNKRREVDVSSTTTADQVSTSQSSGPSPASLTYKGNEYTLFQPWELNYLDALLFTQKQSIPRLLEAGHFILDNPRPGALYKIQRKEDFIAMPAYDPSQEKYRHVFIKVSYVQCEESCPGIAPITVLNITDGKEILNSYVWPRDKVIRWDKDRNDNTINEDVLVEASLKSNLLLGWEAARTKLAQFADAETIFVGHAMAFLMNALRISHKHIFDYGLARKIVP
ncbi:hypothetical protein PG997_007050 [Apiospora hydei]|uniref:Uncharacterized protein n=1 Tax=Apiospora hydei TaxID=1337664 RepID=A0ABR1WQG5_9PEZI